LAFVLKKIVTFAVYPLSICLITLVIGLFFVWFTRRQKLGKILVTAGAVALILFSFSPVTDTLLSSLENKFPPLTDLTGLEDVKWIVVLGGGHNSDSRYPANDQLSGASLSRLVEGIRIHNSLKDSKLILSGGAVFDPIPEAKVMSDVALALGVGPGDLLLELESKDTEDQARLISKLVNLKAKERFILVTNAAHMPRAMALFRKYGKQPIPAPTDFWVKDIKGVNPIIFFPSASSLRRMERVFNEYLGLAWAKIKPKNK